MNIEVHTHCRQSLASTMWKICPKKKKRWIFKFLTFFPFCLLSNFFSFWLVSYVISSLSLYHSISPYSFHIFLVISYIHMCVCVLSLFTLQNFCLIKGIFHISLLSTKPCRTPLFQSVDSSSLSCGN